MWKSCWLQLEFSRQTCSEPHGSLALWLTVKSTGGGGGSKTWLWIVALWVVVVGFTSGVLGWTVTGAGAITSTGRLWGVGWTPRVSIGTVVAWAPTLGCISVSAPLGELLTQSLILAVSFYSLELPKRDKLSWKSALESDKSSQSSISAKVASANFRRFSSSSSSTQSLFFSQFLQF